MASLDIFILVIVGISGLYGLVRGFLKEIFSFVIWFLSFAVALNFHPFMGSWLSSLDITQSASMITVLSFIFVFLGTFIIGNIIFKFVRSVLEKSQLGFLDRVFGLLFGVLRALIIVVLIMMIANLILGFFDKKLSDYEFWQESQAVPYFDEMQAWALSFFDFEHEISPETLKNK